MACFSHKRSQINTLVQQSPGHGQHMNRLLLFLEAHNLVFLGNSALTSKPATCCTLVSQELWLNYNCSQYFQELALCPDKLGIESGFLDYWHFGSDFSLWLGFLCIFKMFGSIPHLWASVDDASSSMEVLTTKNVPRHCMIRR